MSTPWRFWLSGLTCAIAWGCSGTTASGGGGGSLGADANTDIAFSDTDASGKDTTDTSDVGDVNAVDTPSDTAVQDATEGETWVNTCPPVLVNAALGRHGKPCTSDIDCAYGLCQRGSFLTGYDLNQGYCTKDCGCSATTAQCSDDNAGGAQFACGFEVSQSGGNTKAGDPPLKRCALQCKADADCAAWNPALPHCIGSSKYVSSSGVCGFDPFK